MTDDHTNTPPESADATPSRRGFLKFAGAAAASAAAASVGCAPAAERPADAETRQSSLGASRRGAVGFDRPLLGALGEVMLPASLGATARTAAVNAFAAWVDAYDPVAEEMHGYGYADVRYLPPDPAPGWSAQLSGLDVLARKMRGKPFTTLDLTGRQDVVRAALATVRDTNLPDPLGASHVAVALVSHWAASPGAWDLAMGVQVAPNSCRSLGDATARPLPVVGAQG